MKPSLTKAKPAFVSSAKALGTDYHIYVDAPKGHTGPLAAVLLMDGDFFFDPAVEASRALQKEGRIPPTAVIGVGYGASFGQPGNYRGRDYTPTAAADEPLSGGAAAFLEYLTGTLWPELGGRYKLRNQGRVIAGHSLGSLLVLYALFQEKPFFTRALASAPSIWWDNRSILGIIAKLRKRHATLKGKLYLGVGEEDSPSMLGDLGLLEKQLKDHPFTGLSTQSCLFADRDHYNAAPDTVRSGLADLLGPDSVS
jgi:predicted alpha/beta superfamily hydrolase